MLYPAFLVQTSLFCMAIHVFPPSRGKVCVSHMILAAMSGRRTRSLCLKDWSSGFEGARWLFVSQRGSASRC
ncbi:hypothetical protein BD413DRAFT_560795 [Trametes elegans]|nr:hypothetical protein BD413DRAFT_560795 [Trametes elegans]